MKNDHYIARDVHDPTSTSVSGAATNGIITSGIITTSATTTTLPPAQVLVLRYARLR